MTHTQTHTEKGLETQRSFDRTEQCLHHGHIRRTCRVFILQLGLVLFLCPRPTGSSCLLTLKEPKKCCVMYRFSFLELRPHFDKIKISLCDWSPTGSEGKLESIFWDKYIHLASPASVRLLN